MDNATLLDALNFTESRNGTVDTEENVILKNTYQLTLLSLQLTIMVGMGTVITVQDVWRQFKTPSGIIIALACQFAVLPLCAFGLINAFRLSAVHSLSVMTVACCPGGSTSNLYTYLFEGDVPLSVVLTTVSTALAIGVMPFNLWIYSRSWQVVSLQVPYKDIVATLGAILVPMTAGMLFKVYCPKIAPFIAKVTSTIGVLLLGSTFVLQYFLYPESYTQSSSLWILAVAIPNTGFLTGYLLSFLCRQTHQRCRTIAMETGMQSITLALVIIMTSFPKSLHSQLTPFPNLYGLSFTIEGILMSAAVCIRNASRRKTLSVTQKSQVSSITK